MKIIRIIVCIAILACTLTSCARNSEPVSPQSANTKSPGPADDDCGLPVADPSQRVDLITPAFSNPLDADNPLFPVGVLDRAVLLGLSEGETFRAETTRLSGTEPITVNGKRVQTIISQYVAWIDRRIAEVALDWYGQDDQGNVWYFGEDVFNYEDGVVADHEGTWRAGKEFPVAMIMPANPQVGNVWRPENACPIVFEEVTALQTGVTVDGPRGQVAGALLVRELHMEGTTEDKTFAPGYGEFFTGSGEDVEALAIAVPTDFLGGSTPDDLDDLSDGADNMFALARSGAWDSIEDLFDEMEEDWQDFEATGVPPLVADEMNDAIDVLDEAISAHNRAEARQGAIDVALACLDFELQYEPRRDIDRDLIEVWTMQLELDKEARDRGGIRSDMETIRVIRDRLR